jgi:dipeptidyl aminopeptidase/acylaminoacyl peptidase
MRSFPSVFLTRDVCVAKLSQDKISWKGQILFDHSNDEERILKTSHNGVSQLEQQHTSASNDRRVPITETSWLDMRLAGGIAISPDGKQVAFEVSTRPPGQDDMRTSIWLGEIADAEPRPLTKGKKADSCPRWSPDGKRLAFTSKGEGEKDKAQLHIMEMDSGEIRQVCSMPNGVSELAWSPDGSRIAFLTVEGEEPQSDPKVFTLDDQGRHLRLWTVRPDYDTPEAATPAGMTVWEYTWSPDGRQFALYYSSGAETTHWYHSQIGIVPAHGGIVQQLTRFEPRERQASALAWSPDGKYIAFVSGRWSDPGRGGGDIYRLDLENGAMSNLTPDIKISPTWLAWFSDCQRILYTAVDGVRHQTGILHTANGHMMPLDREFVMQWDQPYLSPTNDLRTFATVHSTSQQPPDVYSGTLQSEGKEISGIAWQRLTRLNPIEEETYAWATSQPIRYQSVDGEFVDALFTPPLKQPGGELPPLFVNVHGGPSGAWCDDWSSFYTQMLASAGYAVLRANYRGSWGQGMAFANGVIGDMGGKDFQDIMYGVDYLIAQGLVDGERLAIGGWSNGGYLSAWAVTQTTRFKAAIMGAGISDWFNMHAQSNIADADMLLLDAEPLENPEPYHHSSPMTYAKRVTTPTLILHGENDPAVPVAQAYAFYRALCERRVPVELVVYPREGHGLREKDHGLDANKRVLRWLEQYV